MDIEVIVLNKNHYEMDNNKGANLTIFGAELNTDFQEGISISETPIPHYEHKNINVFPAKYKATATMGEVKNRSGKKVTGLSLSNLRFVSKVEFKDITVSK